MNNRLRHVDIARGIAILLVVFGHNWLVCLSWQEKGKLWESLYSFHLPLFFFLSGVLFKPERGLNYLVIRKADSLLKPYFVVLALITGVLLVRFIIVTHPTEVGFLAIIGYYGHVLLGIIGYYSKFIYGTASLLPFDWEQLWFLPHLWVLFIFSYAFLKVVGYENQSTLIKSFFLLILLSFGCLTIGLLGTQKVIPRLATLGLPFSIEILSLTAFYFLCGYTIRQFVKEINTVENNVVLLFIAIAAFLSLHYFFNYRIDLTARVYDNPLVCTAEAFSGIYITIAASRIISRNELIGNALAYIGTASIFILIFHQIIQERIWDYLHNVILLGPYLSAVAAFPIGVCIPLLLWEIVKRNHYLSLLFLPLKSIKTLQIAGEEKGM